jgi:hypothetical protein
MGPPYSSVAGLSLPLRFLRCLILNLECTSQSFKSSTNFFCFPSDRRHDLSPALGIEVTNISHKIVYRVCERFKGILHSSVIQEGSAVEWLLVRVTSHEYGGS